MVGATLPENAIVVDESMTSGRGLMAATKGAPPTIGSVTRGAQLESPCLWLWERQWPAPLAKFCA